MIQTILKRLGTLRDGPLKRRRLLTFLAPLTLLGLVICICMGPAPVDGDVYLLIDDQETYTVTADSDLDYQSEALYTGSNNAGAADVQLILPKGQDVQLAAVEEGTSAAVKNSGPETKLLSASLSGSAEDDTVDTGDDPNQWPALLALLNDYPITLLIIHPRVRTEFYKGRVHRDAFAWAQANTGLPLCYNGDLLTPADVSAAPNVPLMFGRGLQADPSLLRRLRGGERASAAELQAFHDAIYTAYRRDYSGDVPVLHRMRELWNYLAGSFRNTEPLLRAVRKARTCAAYEQAVQPFFARAEMIRE